jgi:hypothetical protein
MHTCKTYIPGLNMLVMHAAHTSTNTAWMSWTKAPAIVLITLCILAEADEPTAEWKLEIGTRDRPPPPSPSPPDFPLPATPKTPSSSSPPVGTDKPTTNGYDVMNVYGQLDMRVSISDIARSSASRRLLETPKEAFMGSVTRFVKLHFDSQETLHYGQVTDVVWNEASTSVSCTMRASAIFTSDRSSDVRDGICSGFSDALRVIVMAVSDAGFTASSVAESDVNGMSDIGLLRCNVVTGSASVADASGSSMDTTTASVTAGGRSYRDNGGGKRRLLKV